MKYRRQWNICMAVLACLLVQLMAGNAAATPPGEVIPVVVDASRVPGAADKVELWILVKRPITCVNTKMELETTGLLKVAGGTTTRALNLHKDTSFETSVTLQIAPDDTCSVFVRFSGCEQSRISQKYAFVSTGDTLEIYRGGIPTKWVQPEGTMGASHPSKMEKYTDTVKHAYTFDLSERKHFEIFKAFESIVSPDRPMNEPGIYTVQLTRYRFKHAIREGMIGWPAGEKPDSIPIPDSTDSGSSDIRGIDAPGTPQDRWVDGVVRLDSIVGEPDNPNIVHSIPTGEQVTFCIAMWNHGDGNCVNGIASGLRVYSPNGAEWDTTTISSTGAIGGAEFDLTWGTKKHSCDGVGADTVGIFGAVAYNECGMPDGFNEITHTITIGPISDLYVGDTICLDSSWFRPSGWWKWVWSHDTSFAPCWRPGGYCFEIVDGDLDVEGSLYYSHPQNPGLVFPARDVDIELWDSDVGLDQQLDSTTTNDLGQFWFEGVSNEDYYGTGTQDIYLKLFPKNDAASVRSEPPLYVKEYILTPTHDDIPGGLFDTIIVLDSTTDQSGMFFVVDALLNGYRTWLDSSSTGAPGNCWVRFEDGGGTYYWSGIGADIYVDTADDIAGLAPDTWDRDVILHEQGHYIADEFDFFDDGGGHHVAESTYTPELGASEGFAGFWQSVVTGSPIFTNYDHGFYFGHSINYENGEKMYIPSGAGLVYINAMGMSNEVAAGGVLWDICDEYDDDYSARIDWGVIDSAHTPDMYFGDEFSDGLSSILAVLLNETPKTIDEFYDGWLYAQYFGSSRELTHIGYEHGKPCCELVGDSDRDGGLDADDAYDMINFMFGGGPAPSCPDELDINGDWPSWGQPTPLPLIDDLVYLVTYLFQGGPPPVPCS